MSRNRLEAFSDGVLAIIITILVLELHVPEGADLAALSPLLPVFLTYVMSFAYVAIYWNNHHHMLHTTQRITGRILWANMALLFWLSLIPFTTGWMGRNPEAPVPSAVYGVVLLMAAVAYFMLQGAIIADQGSGSLLARAVGRDAKGKSSVGLYLLAIGLSLMLPALGQIIYVLVAVLWLVPDRRIESTLQAAKDAGDGDGQL